MIAIVIALAYWLWPYILLVAIFAIIIGFLDARVFPKPRQEKPDLVGKLWREEFVQLRL